MMCAKLIGMNNEQKLQVKVTAVTIMYGDRWKFLSQVLGAVMRDPYISTFVIVDNGSKNEVEIKEGVEKYGERVVVLKQEKNLGSAGGFAVALEYARGTECDYVFVLDDDSVPEDGTVHSFLKVLDLFPDKKVVLSGNRPDVLDNKEYFYKPSIQADGPRGTFFEVFSVRKFVHFFKLLFLQKKVLKRGPFIPIIPTESFVYGGSFIPVQAVREVPLPDKTLFLYGDDIEYSWNIKKMGYSSYLCAKPIIHDVDLTFGSSSSHIFGQFDATTAPFKVYYRLRNMVRLSRKHTSQTSLTLFANVVVWVLGLFILGFFKYGLTRNYFSRIKLMSLAVFAGYFPNSDFAKKMDISFPQTKL